MEGTVKPRSKAGEGIPVKKFAPAELPRRSLSLSCSSAGRDDSVLGEQVTIAVDKTKALMDKLTRGDLLTPGEETRSNRKRSFCVLEGDDEFAHDKASDERSFETRGQLQLRPALPLDSREEVLESLRSLVDLVQKTQEHVKQQKFKNLMLSASLKDINSRKEVEMNLSKYLFERVKYQLNMEKDDLKQQIRSKDMKIKKYRDTIIEKNIQINKLMRILNGSTTSENSTPTDSTPLATHTVDRSSHDSKNLRPDSNMLNTLGILASRVLSEKSEVSQSHDYTESENSHSHDSSLSFQLPTASSINQPLLSTTKALHYHSMPTLQEVRHNSTPVLDATTSSRVPSTNLQAHIALPKLSKLATLDRTATEVDQLQ